MSTVTPVNPDTERTHVFALIHPLCSKFYMVSDLSRSFAETTAEPAIATSPLTAALPSTSLESWALARIMA